MIRFMKFQNKNEKNQTAFGKWYARAVCDETEDIKGLAAHMASHNTPYSTGAIHGMLKDMVNCTKELLLDGKNVKIDDLAIFSVGLHTTGAPTADDFNANTNITGVRLRARATGNLTPTTLKLDVKIRELTEYGASENKGSDSESPDEI